MTCNIIKPIKLQIITHRQIHSGPQRLKIIPTEKQCESFCWFLMYDMSSTECMIRNKMIMPYSTEGETFQLTRYNLTMLYEFFFFYIYQFDYCKYPIIGKNIAIK